MERNCAAWSADTKGSLGVTPQNSILRSSKVVSRTLVLTGCDEGDELSAGREACCLEDAVFSRIPNWRRRCMGFYFSSSWIDSPFDLACLRVQGWFSALLCWPSQRLNSLSFLNRNLSPSLTM